MVKSRFTFLSFSSVSALAAILLTVTGLAPANGATPSSGVYGKVFELNVEADTTAPLAGVTVTMTCSGSPISADAVTDAEGQYVFTLTEAKSNCSSMAFVEAGHFGRSVSLGGAGFSADGLFEQTDRYLVKQGSSTLTGTVLDVDGTTPAASIDITLTAAFRTEGEAKVPLTVRTTTDELGAYSIENLVSGSDYAVSASTLTKEKTVSAFIAPGQTEKTKNFTLAYNAENNAIGVISGLVTEKGSSAAISGATVCAGDEGVCETTDETGFYEVTSVPLGSVELRVSKDSSLASGFIGEYKIIELSASQSTATNVDVELSHYRTGNNQLAGLLVDGSTGISGVEVALQVTDRSIFLGETIITDASGNWSVSALPDGEYLYYYVNLPSGPRTIPLSGAVKLSGGQSVIRLADHSDSLGVGTSSLTIVAFDETANTPVPSLSISVQLSGSSLDPVSQTTDSTGRANFTNLNPGSYQVWQGGSWRGSRTVTVQAGVANLARLPLSSTAASGSNGVITGTITGQLETDGSPVPLEYASVNAYTPYGDWGVVAYTDAAGEFTISNAPTGVDIIVVARPPDPDGEQTIFAEGSAQVQATAGGVSADFTLREAVTLTGELVDSDGTAVANTAVLAYDMSNPANPILIGSDGTDELGKFSIPGVRRADTALFVMPGNGWNRGQADSAYVAPEGGAFGLGYVTASGLISPVIDDAKIFEVTANSATWNLGQATLSIGNTISGRIMLDISNTLVSLGTSQAFWVELLSCTSSVGSSCSPVGDEAKKVTQLYDPGAFYFDAIPDGYFVLAIEGYQRIYVGESGQSTTLSGVSAFDLDHGKTSAASILNEIADVGIAPPAPLTSATAATSAELEAWLNGLISAPSEVAPGDSVTIDVGQDLVGEWVSASIGALTPAQPLASLKASGSVAPSPKAVITSDWIKVGANGKFTLPSVSGSGSLILAVKDSDGNVIGWQTLTVAAVVDPPSLYQPETPASSEVKVVTGSDSITVTTNYRGSADKTPSYYEVWTGTGANKCLINGKSGSCSLGGLTPETEYKISVLAGNKIGASEAFTTTVLTTAAVAPAPAPASLTVLVASKKFASFAVKSSSLSKALKTAIRKFVEARSNITSIKCQGFAADGLSRSKSVTLATKRAKAVCSYAKKINPSLITKISTKIMGSKLAANRKVMLSGFLTINQ